MSVAVVDVDDLHDERQIEMYLAPLHEAVPSLIVTCYTIPNLFGPVTQFLRDRYPWIVFAIHGFEHTFAECRSWTTDLAKARVERALEMGYEKLFKPPQWICDPELEQACRDLGVVLHHHADYKPTLSGLRCYCDEEAEGWRAVHTHLQKNPSTDWIATHPWFTPEYLRRFDGFETPISKSWVVP